MTPALQQALEQITALTEAPDPDEQARAEELQALATPESQAFLDELRAEALAEYTAGETIPGAKPALVRGGPGGPGTRRWR